MAARTITITGFQRPSLFAETLRQLALNPLQGWHVHVAVEPGPAAAEFAPICAAHLPEGSWEIVINETRLGVCINPFQNITRAFASGSRFNLNLEEDLHVAPDALALAEWYFNNRRANWAFLNLLAGPCGVECYLSRPDLPETLVETRVFNSLGFAIDWQMWREFAAPAWQKQTRRVGLFVPRNFGARGWDWALYQALNNSADLCAVQPLLARASHNGPVGTHADADWHNRTFGRLPVSRRPHNRFDLRDWDELEQDVAAHLRGFNTIANLHARQPGFTPADWFSQLLGRFL